MIRQQYNIRDNIRDNITAVHKTPPSASTAKDDITYFDATTYRFVFAFVFVFIFMCIDINDFNFMHFHRKKVLATITTRSDTLLTCLILTCLILT